MRQVVASDSPVADAAERGERARVQALLEKSTDVNAPQVDGTTALHWAAYRDDLDTARLLIVAKADVNAKNKYGIQPLFPACTNGNERLIELLLESGADVNATLRGGETPLMVAARTGKVGPVKLLLVRGAAVDAKERRGQTALMWAAADGHVEVVETLIKAGADFRASLNSGFTPLLFAVREGKTAVVHSLLKAGADINALMQPRSGSRNASRGISPLILAVENAHFELAVELIKLGADPNDQRSGYTPLHTISWVRKPDRGDDGTPPPVGSGNLNSLDFVKALIAHGADVNAQVKSGAPKVGSGNKVGATPFFMAALTSDVPLMRLLVDKGADPLLPNADGCTPLMAAAGVFSRAPDEEAGIEPEVLAALQLAIELGGDVNTVDKNGETAMHGAAYKNLPKVVQFLEDHGAKIDVWNRKNKSGWTPLLIAEGFRPGNFKPSEATITALYRVMRANGVTPPPRLPPPIGGERKDYAAETKQ